MKIKIFRDSESMQKFFYHFDLFGLKFRVATILEALISMELIEQEEVE